MSRRDDERINDILDAADELALIVARGRQAYDDDPIPRRAAERLLGIIGEAAKGVSDDRRAAFPEAAWSDAARLRDLLAHQYFRIDAGQVWTTARDDIPVLANRLRERRSDAFDRASGVVGLPTGSNAELNDLRDEGPDCETSGRFSLPDDFGDDADEMGDLFGLPR